MFEPLIVGSAHMSSLDSLANKRDFPLVINSSLILTLGDVKLWDNIGALQSALLLFDTGIKAPYSSKDNLQVSYCCSIFQSTLLVTAQLTPVYQHCQPSSAGQETRRQSESIRKKQMQDTNTKNKQKHLCKKQLENPLH